MPKRTNIAMLLSGSGRTLQNLIDETAAGRLDIEIKLVIASREGLAGSERAAKAGLRNVIVARKGFADAEAFSRAVFKAIDEAKVDLVVMAGWLCHLPIPGAYTNRVMNIHPALLPSFGGKGMYGQRVHEAVLAHGCKISGCTVHFVDNEYDAGPIILQRACPVRDTDDAHTLAERVFAEECIAYPEAIRMYQRGLNVSGRRVAGV